MKKKLSVLKWDIVFKCKLLADKRFRELINKNKEFRNTHKGERCFIVGNAPSLKEMDLERLKDEFVLTVNNICFSEELYAHLNPNAHIFIDPDYFRMPDDVKTDFISKCQKFNNDIFLFTSTDGIEGYDKKFKANINYLYLHREWTNGLGKIDLCTNLYIAQNVVQVAIYIAAYMGFTDIYLIGCDMTAFMENLQVNANRVFSSYHAFDISEYEKQRLLRDVHSRDNAYVFWDYARMFDIFKNIQAYAEKNSIHVINATKGGVLDMFPRVDYNALF